MRLRNHRIHKTRKGWRVQPLTATDGEKPIRIVDTFVDAANIAIPPDPPQSADMVEIDGRTYLQLNCLVYLPDGSWGPSPVMIGPLSDGPQELPAVAS